MKRRGRMRRVVKWGSLVVFVVGIGLGAMSFYRAGEVGWDGSKYSRMAFVGLVPGKAYICVITDTEENLQPFKTHRGWSGGRFETFGDVRYRPRLFRATRTGSAWKLDIPLWLAIPFGGLSALLFYREQRRVRPGHCTCGYDLAGLGDGAACPECGKYN